MTTTLHRDSWDQYVAIAEKQIADLTAEVERLRAALIAARSHVVSANQAEHMLDGFSGRKVRPSDGILATIDAALAGNQQSTVTEK